MNDFKLQDWSFLAKPHFNLRDPKGVKPTPLYLVFRIKEKQHKIPLGVKVIPAQWDKKAKKAMISSSLSEMENRNNFIANNKISEFLLVYNNFLQYICNQNEFEIKECIEKFFGMKKKAKTEKISATLLTALRNHNMSESSYEIFYGMLTEFLDWLKEKKYDISIDELTVEIFKEYKDYLFNKKITHKITGEKVFAQNNTVLSKLENIVTIIGYLEDKEELCAKLKKINKGIKTFKQEENQVFIDDNEIEIIYNLELEGKEELARDIFIFQLSSCQRYSDIYKLCGIDLKEFINGDMISVVQKKTKAKVSFPINDKAKSVLEKYGYVLPKLKNDYINRWIKRICKKAKLNEIIHCVELRGGGTYEFDAEKWQLVGTHTTRRTFISNALKDNVEASVIRKISGHKSMSAFERYNRISAEDAVETFLKAKNTATTSNNTSGSNDNSNGETTIHNTDNKALQTEIKLVLSMFDIPAVEWIEIDDIEELYRLLIVNETKICDKAGCDYKVLKDLFNDKNISLKEKVEVIKHMLNNKN